MVEDNHKGSTDPEDAQLEELINIFKQWGWTNRNIRDRKGLPDAKKFRDIADHLEKEVRKFMDE